MIGRENTGSEQMWFDIDQFKKKTKGMTESEIGCLMNKLARDCAASQHDVKQVIDYLNGKHDPPYRFKATGANARHILARLKEYEIDQLLGVIDQQYEKWSGDPTMSVYIRPSTLFNDTKFSSYVGTVHIKSEAQQAEDWAEEGDFIETEYHAVTG
jgi:uncharacterized phage protein (TIGR02220 family)